MNNSIPVSLLNPSIYSASKIWHATKWQEMRDAFGYNVIATWINYDCGTPENKGGAKTFTPEQKANLWNTCCAEASIADMMIVYAEDSDEMRGVLVEMGMIMGAAFTSETLKPIYIIGDCGTFRVTGHSDVAFMYHPSVFRVPALVGEDYRAAYKWCRQHYFSLRVPYFRKVA